MEILSNLLKSLRPRQWVKNLAVFAALVFSGMLFNAQAFRLTLEAALVFVALSGATYLFNDLKDVEADRAHPTKKNRPIASGKLPIWVAVLTIGLLSIWALVKAASINYYLLWSAMGYIALQVCYTSYLKRVPILDVIAVGSGYLIRVYAGSFTIAAHMDVWFLLTVISASLFLAVGKRRSEMTLMNAIGGTKTRETLKRYTEPLLDIYTSMFATATWMSYALFTFNHPKIVPDEKALSLISILPRTLVTEKWLMASIPMVVYGVMRYLQLVYEKNEGESPEKIFLSDSPLIAAVIVWVMTVVGIIYYLP